MNCSPMYPRDESWRSNEACFDHHEEFAMFLEEAKKHKCVTKFHSSPAKTADVVETRKRRRSWKRSLSFLRWKPNKKSSNQKEEHIKTNGSGLMFGVRDAGLLRRKVLQAASGPLAAWFAPTRDEETEKPYMCLGRRTHHSGSQAFGPIYLVT